MGIAPLSVRAMQRRDFLKATSGAVLCAAGLSPLLAAERAETLKAAGATRNLLAGSAVSNPQLHNPAVTAILKDECDIVVAENEMKWDAIHPGRDRYDFTQADELAAFAEQNGMKLRGHNLCWHDQLPDWFDAVATRGNAAQLLADHIRTVAGRYAGRMHSWDVVNEAIEPQDGLPGAMRNSLWYKLLGMEYIAIAFRAAAKADPNALLTYNDYGLEGGDTYNDDRRTATLSLLRWMRANDIPIQALGLQSHLAVHSGPGPDWGGLHRFLKEVAKLNLQVFVTELDIADDEIPGSLRSRQKEVAGLCKDYLKNVLRHPQVTAVLTWGMVAHSWGGHHRVVPFDEELRPTPFLGAMLAALQKH